MLFGVEGEGLRARGGFGGVAGAAGAAFWRGLRWVVLGLVFLVVLGGVRCLLVLMLHVRFMWYGRDGPVERAVDRSLVGG